MAKKSKTTPTTAPVSKSKKRPSTKPRAAAKDRAASGNEVDGSYQLVIVESPAKAKTIEKYLGSGFVVRASVGHIRDLPPRAPKGVKQPVPGVDLDTFEPTYVVDDRKLKTVSELKRLAKSASQIWFATDLDREGEAIAWHLTVLLGVAPEKANRVVFDSVTKSDVSDAFAHPRPINMDRVDAQQARRILDRVVGYLVSPVLWKKVAGGLSAGRVQSPATRLIVNREREIAAFTPDESWSMSAEMALDPESAKRLETAWISFCAQKDERGRGPLVRERMSWLADHKGLECELVEVAGVPVKIEANKDAADDLTLGVLVAAQAAGILDPHVQRVTDPEARGRGKNKATIVGRIDPAARYAVASIDTTRTRSKPYPPFITSTLQQAASGKLSFAADRTMRVAQQLYEGIDIPGEGRVGLISYMRTDSTHLSDEALSRARAFIGSHYGQNYLPPAARIYSKTAIGAQEAHEAIRPTDPARTPESLSGSLTEEQQKLYSLIWRSFIACQMVDAQWDSTAIRLVRSDKPTGATFKANGRVLVFDGCYRASGIPTSDSEQTLPRVAVGDLSAPFSIEPQQKFSSPPPRFSEATLVKALEDAGIGRPSTYASIIRTIQDREYVEQVERRFHATDLGMAVNDFLVEAFRENFIEIDYTRRIEEELDEIAQGKEHYKDMLRGFVKELNPGLARGSKMEHVKATTVSAPYACPTCGWRTEYRLGRHGRFLSCGSYPDCKYANPVNREGKPLLPTHLDLVSPNGVAMVQRHGRFGEFLVEDLPRPEKPKKSKSKKKPDADAVAAQRASGPLILNIDRKGGVKFPSPPALLTDLPCTKCASPLNLRDGKRGAWLGCSRFPKCRGRESFAKLPEAQQEKLQRALDAHMRGFVPIVMRRENGDVVPEGTPVELLIKTSGIQTLALHPEYLRESAEQAKSA
ncbi:MAG: type I DNA topoisomerase [Phycisphaerales bacterium]|nr:type I DNA topoisomerase [Phycisphaerales bacterium]